MAEAIRLILPLANKEGELRVIERDSKLFIVHIGPDETRSEQEYNIHGGELHGAVDFCVNWYHGSVDRMMKPS